MKIEELIEFLKLQDFSQEEIIYQLSKAQGLVEEVKVYDNGETEV